MTSLKEVAKELLYQIWYSAPTPQVFLFKNGGVQIAFAVDNMYVDIIVNIDGWVMFISTMPEFDIEGELSHTLLTAKQAAPYRTVLNEMAKKVTYTIPNTLYKLDD